MKRGTITGLLGGLSLMGLSFSVMAEVKDNPYQVIIDRNPFGLKPIPIPEPPKPPEPPVIPPPDVKLTGITTLGGAPKVFLQREDKQAKGKVEFVRPLTVGENEKDITVLMIDAENNVVRIKLGEEELNLDFDKNGVKPGTGGGAVAGVVPGQNPGVPVFNPALPPAPMGGTAAANPSGARGVIVAGGSTGVTPVPSATAPAVNYAQPNNYGPPSTLPARPVRDASLGIMAGGGAQTYSPQPSTPTLTSSQPLSREEVEMRIAETRLRLQQQNSSAAGLLPPTTLEGTLRKPIPAPTPR